MKTQSQAAHFAERNHMHCVYMTRFCLEYSYLSSLSIHIYIAPLLPTSSVTLPTISQNKKIIY